MKRFVSGGIEALVDEKIATITFRAVGTGGPNVHVTPSFLREILVGAGVPDAELREHAGRVLEAWGVQHAGEILGEIFGTSGRKSRG